MSEYSLPNLRSLSRKAPLEQMELIQNCSGNMLLFNSAVSKEDLIFELSLSGEGLVVETPIYQFEQHSTDERG